MFLSGIPRYKSLPLTRTALAIYTDADNKIYCGKNMKKELNLKKELSYEAKLSRMSWLQLENEACRVSAKPESKLEGALADVLLIAFFKKSLNGNDPYHLDHDSQSTSYWDMYRTVKA